MYYFCIFLNILATEEEMTIETRPRRRASFILFDLQSLNKPSSSASTGDSADTRFPYSFSVPKLNLEKCDSSVSSATTETMEVNSTSFRKSRDVKDTSDLSHIATLYTDEQNSPIQPSTSSSAEVFSSPYLITAEPSTSLTELSAKGEEPSLSPIVEVVEEKPASKKKTTTKRRRRFTGCYRIKSKRKKKAKVVNNPDESIATSMAQSTTTER